jgi:methionyl-tRNA formyltransferase
MVVATLADLPAAQASAIPQPESGATYAHKIKKAETVLDWSRPAKELECTVRAFRPSPGASTVLEGEPIKVWQARERHEHGEPGILLRLDDGALIVGCGRNALEVTEIQRAGGRRLTTAEFLRGRALIPGTRFG